MAQEINIGCEINLDEGQGEVLRAVLIDDILGVCSSVEIEFYSQNKLTFDNSKTHYFTYDGIDWIPASISETAGTNGGWTYIAMAYPRQIHIPIFKPCLTTADLAASMGLKLSPDSQILKIKCPIINIYSGNLIQEIRKQSFDDAYINRNFGDAYFIYISSKYLYSTTWKTMVASQALELTDPLPILKGQNTVRHIQDRVLTDFRTAVNPEPWSQNDYLYKMMIDKFEIKSSAPSIFSKMYTMKFTDSSELDMNDKYMCVHSEYDATNTDGATCSFAKIWLSDSDSKKLSNIKV